MMATTTDSTRPLPPAKARRALRKTSSTPPPAYGSPFTFPSRGTPRQDILGSPMVTTFQMVGWGADPPEQAGSSDLPEDLAWMNEKSREELKDLLLKADVILKERENELGLTSAICKSLYDDNVALQTKHHSLLTRQPLSPPRSTSTPENLSRLSLQEDSPSMTYSSSDSALGLITTPQPNFHRTHAHRISVSSDVSYLEEQNAELLNKLDRLEAEATSADHAGRRELKRLEREIAFLREALEKTQAKSEELEEKVQGAVVSEAWRRKQEREIKVRAMRDLRRNAIQDRGAVKNFAPEGSKFGGPNDTFSFFPSAESPDPNRQLSASSSSEMDLKLLAALPIPEHSLISQLLVKVQELEETNTKILKQQSETAEQLSAVQRETVNMTRAYESLADADTMDGRDTEPSSARTIKFPTIVTDLGSEMAPHIPDAADGALGLFDEETNDQPVSQGATMDGLATGLSSLSFWSEGCDGSWSSLSSQLAPLAAPLSPIHFFSPMTQLPEVDAGPTLQSELERQLGNDRWDNLVVHNHLRNNSLYDLSQISVPPSPTPASRLTSRRPSDELDYEDMQSRLAVTYQKMSVGMVRLSVEPPTPDKVGGETITGRAAISTAVYSPGPARQRHLADTIRNRTTRWVDRKYKHKRNHSLKGPATAIHSRKTKSSTKSDRPGPRQRKTSLAANIHQRLSSAVEGMLEKFTFEVAKVDDDRASESGTASPPSSAYTDPEGISRPGTPKDLSKETALELQLASEKSPQKSEHRNESLMLKLWLWLQFIVVILFFLYAMAKRGPADILSEKNKKAVVRR